MSRDVGTCPGPSQEVIARVHLRSEPWLALWAPNRAWSARLGWEWGAGLRPEHRSGSSLCGLGKALAPSASVSPLGDGSHPPTAQGQGAHWGRHDGEEASPWEVAAARMASAKVITSRVLSAPTQGPCAALPAAGPGARSLDGARRAGRAWCMQPGVGLRQREGDTPHSGHNPDSSPQRPLRVLEEASA